MAAPDYDEIEVPQVVNLSQTNVNEVHAELVRASHAAIQTLKAEEADVNGIIIGTANTGKLTGRRVIAGMVTTQQAELEHSFIGGVRGEVVNVNGKTGMMVATTINAPEVSAVLMAGAEVNAGNIRTGLLIGRNVNGNIETLVDAQTAILAGVIGGAVGGLILLAGRLLFRKK